MSAIVKIQEDNEFEIKEQKEVESLTKHSKKKKNNHQNNQKEQKMSIRSKNKALKDQINDKETKIILKSDLLNELLKKKQKIDREFNECLKLISSDENSIIYKQKDYSKQNYSLVEINSKVNVYLNPVIIQKFYYKQVVDSNESEIIEYKRYSWPFKDELNKVLTKTICGFINRNGGYLFIGISDDKVIEGIYLTNKELDDCKNYILNLTTKFYPKCKKDLLLIFDYPVYNTLGDKIKDLYILKIVIKKGKPNKLYSVEENCYRSFIRIQGHTSALSCVEVEEEIKRRAHLDENEFQEQMAINGNFFRESNSSFLNNNQIDYGLIKDYSSKIKKHFLDANIKTNKIICHCFGGNEFCNLCYEIYNEKINKIRKSLHDNFSKESTGIFKLTDKPLKVTRQTRQEL